jgi:hypothetical protein
MPATAEVATAMATTKPSGLASVAVAVRAKTPVIY